MILKPCPFCGGEAVFSTTIADTILEEAEIRFQINCKKCKAETPGASGFITFQLTSRGEVLTPHNDVEKAVDAWNRRAGT